jgi:hypothetical protein
MSQNSCARTDIILKRDSRRRDKHQKTSSTNHEQQQQQQQEIPSIPSLPPAPPSTAMMMMGVKQEDRNSSVCL